MEIVDTIDAGRKRFSVSFKPPKTGNMENVGMENVSMENVRVEKIESIDPVRVGGHIPSIYQQDIYNFIKEQVLAMQRGENPQNLMIMAGAGCAKSSTIVASLTFIPMEINGKKIYVNFCAFNKDIVEDLKKKVPANVYVGTFHHFGYKAILYAFRGTQIRVDDKGIKMKNIFEEMMKDASWRTWNLLPEEGFALLLPFLNLVGKIKNTFLSPTNENLGMLCDEYDIETEDVESKNGVQFPEFEKHLFDLVREGISRSNKMIDFIEFDDMIYLPILLNLRFFRADVVMVDETQDLNNTQLLMLERMIKPNGMMVCVGDPNQSIYRFRGADSDAMSKMREKFNCKTLPLMRTYRCCKEVVKLANNIVPELEADENNPIGEVNYISYDKFYEIAAEGDMVLCRNTAPLIKPAFKLLAEGKKVKIKGRDIGEGLIKIVKGLKVPKSEGSNSYKAVVTMEDFWKGLELWKKFKIDNAVKKKKSERVIESISDKYDCIEAIADGCDRIDDVISRIEGIFSDGRAEITLSTIHRSKGLESSKVKIIEPDLIPSSYAIKEKDKKQERNLLYVGITRAKLQLDIVGGQINFMRLFLKGI